MDSSFRRTPESDRMECKARKFKELAPGFRRNNEYFSVSLSTSLGLFCRLVLLENGTRVLFGAFLRTKR